MQYRRRGISILVTLVSWCIVALAQFVTAVQGVWKGVEPTPRQRIYFANHCSHGDFVLIWTVMPETMRAKVRPVAGADYWMTGKIKRFIGQSVFNAVLIERNPETRTADPVATMAEALDCGDSLIVFPEGTRNLTEDRLLPFKSGLFHLATARPEIDLVPVWIENLNRVMPKGAFVPIPLICKVTFGAPMRLAAGEDKDPFLRRTEAALLELAPAAKDRGSAP